MISQNIELKQQINQLNEETALLRATLASKEREVADLRAVVERLTRERDNLSDVIRGEFSDRMTLLETGLSLINCPLL
jgi:chromosome segregation ATPase